MKKFLLILLTGVISFSGWKAYSLYQRLTDISGAPPYGVPEQEAPQSLDPYAWIKEWKRPEGPAKVALQVGHWNNNEFPEELAKLRNNGGASGGGKSEWEINLKIAQQTKLILEAQGVNVEILPATVPPKYWADVFVAIHADGNVDTRVNGYKFAAPWRDFTNKAQNLVNHLEQAYEESTALIHDPNVSRNMRGYYAFAWWRYEHAVHPMTTAVIAETGFLTSPQDRKIIVNKPELSAQGLANGILAYLVAENLLPPT